MKLSRIGIGSIVRSVNNYKVARIENGKLSGWIIVRSGDIGRVVSYDSDRKPVAYEVSFGIGTIWMRKNCFEHIDGNADDDFVDRKIMRMVDPDYILSDDRSESDVEY